MDESKDEMKKSLSRKLIEISCSEILGTAILLFVSCLGSDNVSSEDYHSIHTYITSGLAVMIVMHLFCNISGAHVNPMTTICAVVMEEIPITWSIVYFLSEMIGGIIGYGLLMLVTPNGVTFGINKPSPKITITQALLIEVLITFILCLANCASWDKRNASNKDSVAIRFGLLVMTMNIIAAPYTGASMNPARSFAPALWNNYWTNHWIYWIGPISSGLIGSILYKIMFLHKKSKNCVNRES